MPRRRQHRNFDRQRNRERRRQYYLNRRDADRPQDNGAGAQDVLQAVNELHALELEIGEQLPEPQIQPQPNFDLPPQHYIGAMDNSCRHCGSKFFVGEQTAHNVFTKCCFGGKVVLPPIVQPAPHVMELFNGETPQSRHFLQNIRNYNAALAMASWNATVNELPGRGPRVVTIHGQTYHLTSAADAPEGTRPEYSQLYIMDTNQALQERIHDPRNAHLRPDVLQLLQDELMAVNPYARQFRNMGQVLQQQRDAAAANNEPVPQVRMIIARRPFQDRRYDNPTATEIAAVYVGDEGAPPDPANRDITVFNVADNNTQKIKITSPNADPMTYPLLFFHGDFGWNIDLQRNRQQGAARGRNQRERISLNEFYAYRIAVREDFSAIHCSRLLFQQYLVDAYTKIEGNQLTYIRTHQTQMRVESYQGLMDHVERRAQAEDANVGRIVILPATFEGSTRSIYQNYQDAMTIVTKYGKPDIFLTMTANPNWPEVQENILPHQTANDRPDIVSRVFHLKLKELLCDLLQRHVLGHVIAYVYTIEFQKRGLPHAHMVLFLSDADKPRTAEDVDMLVSAEIPDPQRNAHLHEVVKKHMIHGPCGQLDPHCVCMQDGQCKKDFPKALVQETELNVNGYPLYRRRGQHLAQLRHHMVNDSWVVPYSPQLLTKFNCHMNVEICTTVKSVKYIFKYIHKGNDSAHVEIRNNILHHDEILQYLNARYVGPHQAVFRIMQYKMHDKSHTIIRLAVHLPLQQNVYFQEGNEDRVLNVNPNTTLTAWFQLNQEDPNAQQYLYSEIPHHYTFDQRNKRWKMRQRQTAPLIGRIYQVQPSDPERFALRLLLLHRRGVTSFEDIRTIDGHLHETFKGAARALGLLEDDAEHRRCLQEASIMNMPSQMRQLFATLMVFQTPSDIRALFEQFKEVMSEDYVRHDQVNNPAIVFEDRHMYLCLWDIDNNLRIHGKSITNAEFSDLPQLPEGYNQPQNADEDIDVIREQEQGAEMLQLLNDNQLHIHNTVMNAIQTASEQNCYFVDGPAGTGKTFLYNTLVHNLQALGVKVKCVAYSGIAGTLLINGATAHSTFQIPIPLLPDSTCNIKRQSARAQKLLETSLFIWDEASMIPANALKAVDILLRDITQTDQPFGGKYMFLGGDFRQVLPVVLRAGRERIVQESLKNSPLWQHFNKFQLHVNMRATRDEQYRHFADWLLRLGNGEEPHDDFDQVTLPENILLPSLNELVSFLYPPTQPGQPNLMLDPGTMSERCCLTPKNQFTHRINELVLDRLQTPMHTYLSTDRVISEDPVEAAAYPIEFLNAQTPGGMPLHKLQLKIGATVILLRNINPKRGLCNGTRLIVRDLQRHVICAEIIGNEHRGEYVMIPKITMSSQDTALPINIARVQFPVRLAYCLTINKAQGQSLRYVGVYLPEPVFSHGQLYVAMSRAKSFAGIKVMLPEGQKTKNVVYREVLQ